MAFTFLANLSPTDLREMAAGTLEDTVTDMDFLETLAAQKCFLLPPWVMRASPEGGLTRVTRLTFNTDGKLDKPRILLAAARVLRRSRATGRFGPRFSV